VYAELLLARGADVNATNGNGKTPLDVAESDYLYRGAAESYYYRSMAELLRQHGGYAAENPVSNLQRFKRMLAAEPDLIFRKVRGRTVLHRAADDGYIDAIKFLLGNKVDIDTRDDMGETPLHLAAHRGYEDVAKFLLDNGAAVNATDNLGRTPLDKAVYDFDNQAVVRLLLQEGATWSTEVTAWRIIHHFPQ
jgi:ankyrin repeat protein